ncbi:hypothetical protein JCM18918_4276 [Cutibacterium acnes JCM 18918]|nr:hypothetical protein JCM18918_4276 [Cutibacterium acnes JCM 18918]
MTHRPSYGDPRNQDRPIWHPDGVARHCDVPLCAGRLDQQPFHCSFDFVRVVYVAFRHWSHSVLHPQLVLRRHDRHRGIVGCVGRYRVASCGQWRRFMSQDADKKGRGLAMGLLESIRRGVEFLMNVVVIGALALWSGHTTTVMRGFAIAYTLVLVPLIFALLRRVPKNAVAGDTAGKGESANVEALKGLVAVLIKPRMWLAGLAGLCVYWCYVNLIYSSAPYLSLVFKASDAVAGAFGIFNTGLLGIISGLVAGVLADYLFKSSTRMMGIALLITAIGTLAVRLLPVGDGMMWPAMILLMVMAFGIFMGKAVLLAPVAELNLPSTSMGLRWRWDHFFGVCLDLLANPLTAGIIEKNIVEMPMWGITRSL